MERCALAKSVRAITCFRRGCAECVICPLRPLDIETSLSVNGGPLTFAFWDLGWDLSIPLFPDIVNTPDYLTGHPWRITL